jgi:hypothetical protein
MVRALGCRRTYVNRLLKPVIFVLAAAYFLVDAAFMTVAKPLADWISDWRMFEGLRNWIVSLRPYPTLVLFLAPLIVLEPVKPVAACLAAAGNMKIAVALFAAGEILKLVLVERIFAVCRKKLMLIPAFCWAYRKYREVRNWLEATEAWQVARRWSNVAKSAVRGYAMHLKMLQKRNRFSTQLH